MELHHAKDKVIEILENRGYQVVERNDSKITQPRNRVGAITTFEDLEGDFIEDHVNRSINDQIKSEAVGIWRDHSDKVELGQKKAKVHAKDGIVWAKVFREVEE